MPSLWSLRIYARNQVWLVLAAVICGGTAAFLNARSLAQTRNVFEPLFKEIGATDAASRELALTHLYSACYVLLGIMLAGALFNALATYLGDLLGQRVLIGLRRDVFGHLQTLSLAFFEHRRSGELISRVNNDTVVLQKALGIDLAKLIVDPLTVAWMMYQMGRISWRLTLGICVMVPVLAVINGVLGRYARRYGRRTQQRVADLTSVTQETFGAMRVIKTFGLEPLMAGRFGQAALGVLAAEMKAALVRSLGFPMSFGLFGLGLTATLIMGAHEIMAGRVTSGGLMALVLLLQGAGIEITRFARLYLALQQAEAAASRTLELLGETSSVSEPAEPVELGAVEGRITFDHVTFSYNDEEHPVLQDLCLDIKPGEVVALAGRSGSGKTTIANLVPRLYDVQAGAVLVDGVDVRRVAQRSLKRFMGMVPQETVLFGASIRENIGYGREGATDEEIEAAARAASAHDFILGLPEGYDTQVGERGVLLSGGQRQRVAIARAFLRDPRILILDEATSSLDTESEKAIHAALNTLLEGRTALIIAHRLSTIRNADRILVIDRGRIAEQGTHDELMQQGGIYRDLYESREVEEDDAAPAAGPV